MHLLFLLCAMLIGGYSPHQKTQEIAGSYANYRIAISSAYEHEPDHETEAGNCYDPRKDCLYRWYLRATIIGVLGGLVGLFFIWLQFCATKTTAIAAKASADCLKAIERPWLLVKNVDVTSIQLAGGIRAIAIQWDIKNFGKSPAFVSAIGTHIDVVPASFPFAEPIFEKTHSIMFDKPVVPPCSRTHKIISAMKRGWSTNEEADVANGAQIFWFSGRITYTSPWKEKYETWFSLKIDDTKTGANSPIGPDELNKVT